MPCINDNRPGGALFALLAALLVASSAARPLVRNVRTDREFQRLLKHHKEITGLPVIVDYYSDGCGPCRQIAPYYKQLAKQYKNRAVFAKVDVNRNRETSSRQQIRSMPTFQAYLLGKKRQQFSGADMQSLQAITQQLAREAQKYDVELTLDSVKKFYTDLGDKTPYAEDETKLTAQAEKILEKAGPGAPGHYKMCLKLKKKYGSMPETVKFSENSGASKSKTSQSSSSSSPSSSGKARARRARSEPAKPNLHLASMDQLLAEVEKRREQEEEAREETTDDETEEKLAPFVADGMPERVTIIGAGPAGLAAAIYASRAGLSPVIVAPPEGGQLQGKGVLVENFPGVSGITGPVIVQDMRRQAASFGTRFLQELVTHVDLKVRPFKIQTKSYNFTSHAVILATGADSRWLGVEGEYEFRGGGVSSCATCDGFLFRDKPVVVIGGGDTAMEDALVLARTSSSVTIIHRRDSFRASHILASRAMEHPSISVRWNSTVAKFTGANSSEGNPILSHVHIRDSNTGAVDEYACEGAFVAIGHDPNTRMVRGMVDVDDTGYVQTRAYSSRTSVPGFFAAGDVADRVYRQAVTSAGSGAMAALDAERWLSEEGIQDEREAAVDDVMAELLAEFGAGSGAPAASTKMEM